MKCHIAWVSTGLALPASKSLFITRRTTYIGINCPKCSTGVTTLVPSKPFSKTKPNSHRTDTHHLIIKEVQSVPASLQNAIKYNKITIV